MKLQELKLKRPKKILQVFRNINVYGKEEKSFEERKEEVAWKDIKSKSGYVLNNELYLPEKILENPKLMTCNLITIEDENKRINYTTAALRFSRIDTDDKKIKNQCFNLAHPNKFEIFEIKYNDELEVFLKYRYFGVGAPERENFKLCTLKMNCPVEIKINGKTDYSLTWRRARVFTEQQYIFHYLGDFDSCKLIKDPFEPVIKHVPDERKVVDLIKHLW